jgi:hypothetical protein
VREKLIIRREDDEEESDRSGRPAGRGEIVFSSSESNRKPPNAKS